MKTHAPRASTQSAAIVLVGGRSRRMGKNKALLPAPIMEPSRPSSSQTFVEHQVTLLSSCCPEVIVVARDPADAQIYAFLARLGARVVYDQQPDSGPLMGLYTGLSAMQAPHALVVAVDLPLLQPALARWLLSFPPSDALLVPLVNAIPQVLCAVYPRSVLPFIETCLSQGRRDPRSLLALAPVRYLPEDELRLVDPHLRSFLNINTPADLHSI